MAGCKRRATSLLVSLLFMAGSHCRARQMGVGRYTTSTSRTDRSDQVEPPPTSRKSRMKATKLRKADHFSKMKLPLMDTVMMPFSDDDFPRNPGLPAYHEDHATTSKHRGKQRMKTSSSRSEKTFGHKESAKERKEGSRRSVMQSMKLKSRGRSRIKLQEGSPQPLRYESLPIPPRPSERADFYPTVTPTTHCSACSRQTESCHQCLSKLLLTASVETVASGGCGQLLRSSK
jgi:hypothetical protein